MTNTIHESPNAPTALPPTTGAAARGLAAIAGVVSGLVAVAAGSWLARPDTYPDHLSPGSETGSLLELVDPTLASSLLLAIGLGGVLLSIAIVRADRSSRAAAAAAATLAGIHTLLLTDLTLLVTLGYSLAILGPPALLAYLTVAAARAPWLRWLVAGLVATGTVLALGLGVDGAAFGDFGRGLGSGLRRSGVGMILNLVAFAGGLLWAMVALRASGLRWWGDRPATTRYVLPRRDWACGSPCWRPPGRCRTPWSG